jgi:uncharacterized protein YcbX
MRWQDSDGLDAFVKRAIEHEVDVGTFGAALKTVPDDQWPGVESALQEELAFGGVEARSHQPGQRVDFQTVDPEKDQARDAKKNLLGAESERRRRRS